MGNVGIGADQPSSKLHVLSNGAPTAQFASTTTEAAIRIMPNNSVDDRFAILTNSASKTTNILGFSSGTNNLNLVLRHDSGNVGIGVNPEQKLDVAGNARVRQMADGNNEATFSRVVVADAAGNLATISRTDPGVPNATETIFANPRVRTNILGNETLYSIQQAGASRGQFYMRNTGSSITLPPGKWTIYCGYIVNPSALLETGTSVWFRGIFDLGNNDQTGYSNLPSVGYGAPGLISTTLGAAFQYVMGQGVWLLDNTTNTNQTYYLKVSIDPVGFNASNDRTLADFSYLGEDYLFAIRRK